ncbi:FitA-like ribbon-helix-helix domain-containing protein [Corynebacterium nuruki]|uniref:FitA-like ribbon-helix-helix domain-containing protein n=1 Tax=Corynebacterium nuruki TaxID=1032851 RepID=UPI0039BF3DA3
MATIQIKNVSPEAHAVLRERAAAAHQSLQEYLKSRLEEEAARPTLEEVLDRIGHRSGGSLTVTEATDAVRADRDRR